jgi:steroid 5-alpha reductase family enzyme
LIYFLIALVFSATGFIRLVYFVSIGYAFSITGAAASALILQAELVTPLTLVHGSLLIVYGLRLGTYLVLRERKSTYSREAEDVKKMAQGVGLPKKILIWLGVSVLYVMMFSPLHFSLLLGSVPGLVLPYIGVAVMTMGLGLEAAADYQKSRFKRTRPDDYCSTGLYGIVRCPNYLGEIIFWTGNLIAGAWALKSWWAWLMVVTGYVCIVLIMIGSTKRLEQKQDERYGEREDYKSFVRTVPVLLPFIPLYSLKHIRVFLE